MTALVTLIFKHHAVKLPWKPDMMSVVTQNAALLILVHSFKKKICQINSAFNLLRFVHNFTRYCVFFTGKQLSVIF